MNARRIAPYAAAAAFIIHAVANPHYGFFRDELYFIICGFHPQWGYVDQPPIVPLLSAATQLGGHSLFLLRAVPALFAAGSVFITCLLVEEFGGGAFAASLASVVAFFCPVLMNFGMKASTDEPGLVLWPLLAWLLLRLSRGADARLWLAAGICAGLAFESKYSIVFFIAALGAGFALIPRRNIVVTPWAAAGAGVAILLALPNAMWQLQHGLPMLELLRNGQSGKNVIAGPALYLLQQVLITNLFFAPVLIAGLYRLLRTLALRPFGFAYVILIGLMIVAHGKHYYPANVYPLLIAAGAVQFERFFSNVASRASVLAAAACAGLVFVPFALPVLSETAFIRYEGALLTALHIKPETLATEHGAPQALPGDWADMHGWPEFARTVRDAYDALPARDRAAAVVKARNYGEASAIAFFAPSVPVISTHNQYFLWGTHGYDGSVLIEIGGDCGAPHHLYASRTVVATFRAPYVQAYEQDLPIAVCRGNRFPLSAIWPSLKDYI